MSHFEQIMRVKAQDARLCLRHAELSLAWGFGSRDGEPGRASKGGKEGWHGAWFRTGLVSGHDTSGPVYPQHTQSALNTCQENAPVCFEAAT